MSKYYGYYQTLNGLPHVEGLASRTLPESYAYINSNPLLSDWRRGQGVFCSFVYRDVYMEALKQLQDDGFSHVILHHDLWITADLAAGFAHVSSAYADDHVTIYRLRDMMAQCGAERQFSAEARSHLERLAETQAILPPADTVTLVALRQAPTAGAEDRGLTLELISKNRILATELGQNQMNGAAQFRGFLKVLQESAVAVFIYESDEIDAAGVGTVRDLIVSRFVFCERFSDAGKTTIDYFIRADIPCALAVDDDAKRVEYDKGASLGNVRLESGDGAFTLDMLWGVLPHETHSVSIQAFDGGGEKVRAEDYVIKDEFHARYHIDLSSLSPGEYAVKLIVYNFDTGASVPGTLVSSGERVERTLDIGRVTIE